VRCRLVAASEIITRVAVDGDRLRGRSAGFLTNAADQAVQAAEALDRSDTGGLTVDTTSLSPDESASMIGDAIGWP
jgi:hypothetical protein